MDFLELAKQRRSVRAYTDTRVSKDLIESCIEAARLAPSACNSQPWYFVTVTDPERRARIAEWSRLSVTGMNRFVSQAPVIVALVAEPANVESRIGSWLKKRPYYLIDIGIAAEHFCLRATEVGLGTCMIGWFDEKKVHGLLDIPPGKRIALLITVGYPGDEERPKRRKSLDAISGRERYGGR